MIPILSIAALLLILGHALIIRRAIALTEQRLQLAEAEEAGLMCCRCGRLLRRGSPYPYPCPCRTARRSRYAL